jgi:hypothetical protein
LSASCRMTCATRVLCSSPHKRREQLVRYKMHRPRMLGCAIGYGPSTADFRTPNPPAAPRINGPRVFGAIPGHPFLYRIPCTGARPIHFAARGLPPSLKLDVNSGIISGQTPADTGEFPLTLEASNPRGKTSRPFKIVVWQPAWPQGFGSFLLEQRSGWHDKNNGPLLTVLSH